MNGLNIDLKEFKTLTVPRKVDLLFQNQESNKELTMQRFDNLEKLIAGYKFHVKVQYVWLGCLSIVLLGTKFVGLI